MKKRPTSEQTTLVFVGAVASMAVIASALIIRDGAHRDPGDGSLSAPALDLEIAPEYRCAPYDREKLYPYDVEKLRHEIVAGMGGRIYGPYTGTYFASVHETQVEHIVALEEAHDSGMCARSREEKKAFASDLPELTLAAPAVNDEKGGKDAGEWLPPFNLCWFAQSVADIKSKYGLTADRTEYDALAGVLGACDSTDMIYEEK